MYKREVMYKEIRNVLRLTLSTLLICVAGYASLILLFAMLFAPEKRMGSLIKSDAGTWVGSRLVAQSFTRPEYLWPRPSAVAFDASGAGGSNLSPTSREIRSRAVELIQKYDLLDASRLPAELVLASGSGLDPHVSLQGALVQAARIARHRNVSEADVRALMASHAKDHAADWFEPAGLVNVLEFNLQLDRSYTLQVAE